MGIRSQVLTSLQWITGGKFLSQIVTWAITLIVIRILSPVDYGLLSMAMVFVGLFSILSELGIGAALIQEIKLTNNTVRRVYGFSITLNSLLFVILFLISPLIAEFYNEPRLIDILRVLGLQFIIMAFGVVPQSILQRGMDFKTISVIEFIQATTASLSTLIFALLDWAVWSLVIGNLIGSSLKAFLLNQQVQIIGSPLFSVVGMRRLLSFGGYVTGTRFLWHFYTQADIFIVGKTLGKDSVGVYSVAMQLASLPMHKISGLINQIAFPAFSSIKGESKSVASHLIFAIRVMSVVSFPLMWGISSIAPWVVEMVLGNKWSTVVLPLQVITIVVPLRMIHAVIPNALLGVGRADLALRNQITATIIMPLAFLLGAVWGIEGISVAWLCAFPIVFLINIWRSLFVINLSIRDVLKPMEKPALAAAAMYICILTTRNYIQDGIAIPLTIVLVILEGILIYGSIIIFIDRKACIEVMGLLKR
jgi:teichuronic acid exporter